MKLISISWSTTPRMPGLRPTDVGSIKLDNPGTALLGWRAVIRGQHMFLISPPGWMRDQTNRQRDKDGPQTVFGPIAMHDVVLEWSATSDELEALYKNTRWESEPFGTKPPEPVKEGESILAQIPPGQVGDA